MLLAGNLYSGGSKQMLFVSYSSKDRDRLKPLVEALKARGVSVWFDEDKIDPGDSIIRKMNEGLSESDRLLVAWSQTASASAHVSNEINSFYKQRPEPGWMLFMLLDNTPVPLLFDERKHIRLTNSIDDVVQMLVKWCEGRDGPQIDNNNAAAAASEPAQILQRLPRGPRVPFRLITHELIHAYANLLNTRTKARQVINKSNQLRDEADADAGDSTGRLIDEGFLPIFNEVGPYSYWQDVFHEACLRGPRMLGALLLAQPDDLFDSEAGSNRARLFQYLQEMNRSRDDDS
jgi:hypothetical protein